MMRRVSQLRNMYVSSNYYDFPTFNSFKHSPPFLQGSNFRGQGRSLNISEESTPNSLQLKANPGNQVENFDIAFHGFTGDLMAKKKVEEEAKGGLDQDMMMQTNMDTKKMKCHMSINIGDVIHLNDLLFTQNRDYLIRSNGQKVKAGELADKVIAVYFVPLLTNYVLERIATTHLIETYNYLRPRNVFEVVLVACETHLKTRRSGCRSNPEKDFEAIFSRMPWTAIPFSDITSRERIYGIYGSGTFLNSFVIDSTGMVLQSYCLSIFRKYGGQGYPFTDERIEFLKSQDDAIAEQPSLKMLLASPERDYVISSKGEKVLIDTLEKKVVALYFYEEGKTLSRLTADIKLAYEEFAEKKNEFEVVLIYLYDTEFTCGYVEEESFCKTFKSMPWLALPFKDPTYRKLKRFFGHNLDMGELVETPSLVIIGPHGEFVEPWGADILMRYKLPAYPFTREIVAKLETDKMRELKLEMLWDRNTLFRRNDGTEVPLYELVGKKIIMIFEGERFYKHKTKFLKWLKTRYARMRDMKGADDEFEVIYITSGKQEALYKDLIFDASWLFASESELLPVDLSLYCCYCQPAESPYGCHYPPGWCGENSTFLAFGRDGRLVRKSLHPEFDETDLFYHNDFPFVAVDMENEALLELIDHYDWLEMDREYKGLLINPLYRRYSG